MTPLGDAWLAGLITIIDVAIWAVVALLLVGP